MYTEENKTQLNIMICVYQKVFNIDDERIDSLEGDKLDRFLNDVRSFFDNIIENERVNLNKKNLNIIMEEVDKFLLNSGTDNDPLMTECRLIVDTILTENNFKGDDRH